MDTVCAPWVRAGVAVASIDLPLHGERANAKLSERVLALIATGVSNRAIDTGNARLWIEFVRQAVIDMRRALDALEDHPEIDTRRAAYAGFSLGAILGVPFCAEDARIRAAALAIGGGGFGPVAVDPIAHIGRLSPRPVLFVNATRDERIPRECAEALHEAAAEPSETLWFDCGHSDLPGRALKAMWTFLERQLAASGTGGAPISGG